MGPGEARRGVESLFRCIGDRFTGKAVKSFLGGLWSVYSDLGYFRIGRSGILGRDSRGVEGCRRGF